MTGETYIIPRGHEELREIAFMRVVTNAAASHRHRAMDKFPPDQILFMAKKAQIRSLAPQLKTIGGLMGIMTSGAFTLFHRRMNHLGVKSFIVAVVAELANVFNRFELMRGCGLMAKSAFSCRYRAMDIFLLAHTGMTLGRDTGFFFCSFSALTGITADQKKK